MGGRGSWVWLGAGLAIALALGVGAWHLVSGVIPVALDAENTLSQFREVSADQMLAEGSSGLEELDREVSRVRVEMEPAGQLMRWVGRFSPAFLWLPAVHQEMAAWSGQMERAQRDLDAASALLGSSSGLILLYSDAQTSLLTAGAGTAIPFLQAQVQELEISFAASHKAVVDARQRGRSVSVGLQAPRVRQVRGLMGELEGRMLAASEVGQGVSGLLSELLEVADGAQPLMEQFIVEGSEPAPWATETLKSALAGISEHALSARDRAQRVAALISETGQGEQLLPDLATLDRVLAVLQTVSMSSEAALSAIEPAARRMELSDVGLLGADGGLIGMFDAFMERRAEIAKAIAQLEEAKAVLRDLESDANGASLSAGLSDISRFVSDLHAGLRLVSAVAPKGRALLGIDAPRKYLILGQSADELRATGGFVSSVWLITFDNAGLANVEYQDSVRVDDWGRLDLYPKAPPDLDEHMNAWVWLLRDVSWDPDFPTTARAAEDIYRLGQRQDVDGVIAITQWTLLRLIEALGEIPSPDGGAVSSRNLLSALEEGTDRYGRAYIDLVLQGLLDRFNQPMSVPSLIRVASGLHDTLQSRDLLVFFDDSDLQSVAGDLGWDGGIRQDSIDYLYVVDSNVGWNKVDRNIERNVSYLVDLRREGRPRVSLSIGYSNHSGLSSSGCEPQWLNRGSNYDQLKSGCYWNFVRVYMPQGARLLNSTPLALPQYSVSAEIGRGVPGEDTGRISSSHDKMIFSGLAAIEAGELGEINLVYDLPASAVKRDGETITYQLLVQKQPGVRQRSVLVDFLLPEGYRLVSSSLSPVEAGDSKVGFALELEQDTLLNVQFKKDADGSG